MLHKTLGVNALALTQESELGVPQSSVVMAVSTHTVQTGRWREEKGLSRVTL